MKKLFVIFAVVSVTCSAYAGSNTYSDFKQTTQPAGCPQWYADNEWNVGLWGTYVFTGNESHDDRYFGVDHAWGGGADAKYFFHRYFGIGIEGSILDARTLPTGDVHLNGLQQLVDRSTDAHRAIGTGMGSFTLRYPIPCSRFAPYVFAAGGGIFGGGVTEKTVVTRTQRVELRARDYKTEEVGQFGGGLEVRLTSHVGLISDFSWNVINGPDNNFGMVRTGLNLAF